MTVAARGFRLNCTSRLTVSRICKLRGQWVGRASGLICTVFKTFPPILLVCAHEFELLSCQQFCIVLTCAPGQNVTECTGKGGLWLPPRNARMQPAPALSPIRRNIAATTAKASGTRWRSCACVATLTVAARLLRLRSWGGFDRRSELVSREGMAVRPREDTSPQPHGGVPRPSTNL